MNNVSKWPAVEGKKIEVGDRVRLASDPLAGSALVEQIDNGDCFVRIKGHPDPDGRGWWRPQESLIAVSPGIAWETSSPLEGTQALIAEECDALKELLLEKNRKYGDSAINPKRVFSKASPVEQIFVRIDDKISRWESAQDDDREDVIQDMIGYFILLRVAKRLEKK